MPHITIQMYPGRDDSLKAKVAREVTETVSKSLNISKENISVSVEDVEKDKWQSTVMDHASEGNKKLFILKGEEVE